MLSKLHETCHPTPCLARDLVDGLASSIQEVSELLLAGDQLGKLFSFRLFFG